MKHRAQREADLDGRPTTPSPRRPRIVAREPIEAIASDCGIPGGKAEPIRILGFS